MDYFLGNLTEIPVSAALLSVLAVIVGGWILLNKKKEDGKEGKNASSLGTSKVETRPEKWAKVGRVERLIIYPIKSCPGVQVNEAVVTTLGLKFTNFNLRDRDFMLVDRKGRSVTMASEPTMALITLKVEGDDEITLEAPGMDTVTFSYPRNNNNEVTCRVKHDSNLKALDCGDEVADWFQRYLGKDDLRLNYHHISQTQRTFEPYMYECPQFEQSDMGAFHNETSYLLVAQESIDELNSRLAKESSWRNWRPTILVNEVSEPFAEVNWSYVRVGNQNGILKTAVPCYRCPLTTVDPDEGILPKDGEPLKTLRLMNKADEFADKKLAELLKNKGIMGLRLGLYLPAGEGAIIKNGDPVYAALL